MPKIEFVTSCGKYDDDERNVKYISAPMSWQAVLKEYEINYSYPWREIEMLLDGVTVAVVTPMEDTDG